MAPRPPLDRLRTRPDPLEWADDELVSLAEAAALFFPAGPLTTASLRLARRRSELACVDVCGRAFTTPRAMREMMTLSRQASPAGIPCRTRRPGPSPDEAAAVLERLRRRLDG